MFTIRPFDFSDADYAIMTAIDTAFYPYPLGEETLRHFDTSRDPKLFFQRDMILRDGQVVAFGEIKHLPWAYHPDKYDFYLVVHPDHEHPDIRPFYWAHMLEVLHGRPVTGITASMFEDKTAHVNFLAAQGFVETQRNNMSELDVTAFDVARFDPVLEKVQAAGIRITTLRDLMQRDPDWKQNLYDLEWALVQDIPSPDPPTKPTLEEFSASQLESPNILPEGWFVALNGDQYVGTSRAFRNPAKTDQLDGSLTGTIRSYRRRGIATALKVHLIRFAQDYGVAVMITVNEEDNPMYALNVALGFEARPVWVCYEKTITADNAVPQ